MLNINALKFFKLDLKLKTSIQSDISEKIRNKYKIKKNHFWLPNLIFRKILKRKTGIFYTIFPSKTGKETSILNQRNAICHYGKEWNILYRNILNKYEGIRNQNIHKIIPATPYLVYPAFPVYESVPIPGSLKESRTENISQVINYNKGSWNILYRNILNKFERIRNQNIHKIIPATPYLVYPAFPVYEPVPIPGPLKESRSEKISQGYNYGKGTWKILYRNIHNKYEGMRSQNIHKVFPAAPYQVYSAFPVYEPVPIPGPLKESRSEKISQGYNYGKGTWNILYRNIHNKYEGMRSQNIHKVIPVTSYQVYSAFPGYESVPIPGSLKESRSEKISLVYNYGKGSWNILYRNILNKYEGMGNQNIHKVIPATSYQVYPAFPLYESVPIPGSKSVSRSERISLVYNYGKGSWNILYRNILNKYEGMRNQNIHKIIPIVFPKNEFYPAFPLYESVPIPGSLKESRSEKISLEYNYGKGSWNILYRNILNKYEGMRNQNIHKVIPVTSYQVYSAFPLYEPVPIPGSKSVSRLERISQGYNYGKGTWNILHRNILNKYEGMRNQNIHKVIPVTSYQIYPAFPGYESVPIPGSKSVSRLERISQGYNYGKGSWNILYQNIHNNIEKIRNQNIHKVIPVTSYQVYSAFPGYEPVPIPGSKSVSRLERISQEYNYGKGSWNILYQNIHNNIEKIRNQNIHKVIPATSYHVYPVFPIYESAPIPGSLKESRSEKISQGYNYDKGTWNILYRNILNKYEGIRSQNIHKVIPVTSYQVYSAFPGYEPVPIPGSKSVSRLERISQEYNYGKGSWNILYQNIHNNIEKIRNQNIHKVIPVTSYQVYPAFPLYESVPIPGSKSVSPLERISKEYNYGKGIWNILHRNILNKYEGMKNQKIHKVISVPSFPKYHISPFAYPGSEHVFNARSWKFNGFQGFEEPTKFSRELHYKSPEPILIKASKPDIVEDEKSRPINKTISENNNHLSNKEQEQEIEKIAERVYDLIEKKIEIEKDRRGLF